MFNLCIKLCLLVIIGSLTAGALDWVAPLNCLYNPSLVPTVWLHGIDDTQEVARLN